MVSTTKAKIYHMAPKVYRSNLTWRTLDYQDSILAPAVPGWPDVPIYTGEDDLQNLLRPTTRKSIDDLYMASLAILAKHEDKFKKHFDALVKKFRVIAVEEGIDWKTSGPQAVKAWKLARKKDSGKHGGTISAERKKAETKEAIELIRDRWPLPSKEWPTSVLLDEADISLNTAKAHLGKRPIAQYNHEAKMKRKVRKDKNKMPNEGMDYENR